MGGSKVTNVRMYDAMDRIVALCKLFRRRVVSMRIFYQNQFVLYSCAVFVCIGGAELFNAIFASYGYPVRSPHWINYFSSIAEGFGLLMVQNKISRNKSVEGLSAQSVSLFAFSYFVRAFTFPPCSTEQVQFW